MFNFEQYGFQELLKALGEASKEFKKEAKDIVKLLGKTALDKSKKLAPDVTGEYKKSIKKYLVNALKMRVLTAKERKSKKETYKKGYLGGVLEYGQKKYRKTIRPHLAPAMIYAMQVHEKDLNGLIKAMIRELKEFL